MTWQELENIGYQKVNWCGIEDNFFHFHIFYNNEVLHTGYVEAAEDLEPTIIDICIKNNNNND